MPAPVLRSCLQVAPARPVAWTICLSEPASDCYWLRACSTSVVAKPYIAASRYSALSYFDHPPLSFWIAWAAMKLTGSDAVLVGPFILLFIATTWLMLRFTAFLFGEKAGAFAALLP